MLMRPLLSPLLLDDQLAMWPALSRLTESPHRLPHPHPQFPFTDTSPDLCGATTPHVLHSETRLTLALSRPRQLTPPSMASKLTRGPPNSLR